MTIDPKEFGELRSDVKHIIDLVGKQHTRVNELEDQVSGLRRWQALLTGAFAVAGTSAGSIIAKLSGGGP